MDHVSHTHSHWTGIGQFQDGKLHFTYIYAADALLPNEHVDKGNGTITLHGKNLVMNLGGDNYVLSKQGDQSR